MSRVRILSQAPASRECLWLLIPLALGAAACDDGRKHAEQAAVEALAKLSPVLAEDVAEVRRGLPAGAAKLGPMLDPDTLSDLLRVQKSISRTRALVPDLDVAKGTFFSYADKDGKVVRSETDPDQLADKSLFPSFPALKKAWSIPGQAASPKRGAKMGC